MSSAKRSYFAVASSSARNTIKRLHVLELRTPFIAEREKGLHSELWISERPHNTETEYSDLQNSHVGESV